MKCLDESGVYRGLIEICKDLGLINDEIGKNDLKLPELRELLSKHPAFCDNNTNLGRLAISYGLKVIFCPKYHCELNPIEGLWCDLKRYVRTHNDQSFDKLIGLINDAINQYKSKNLNAILWDRFWKALELYNSGSTYQEVLIELFGTKSSDKTLSHKKNKNFNTKINSEI